MSQEVSSLAAPKPKLDSSIKRGTGLKKKKKRKHER
jgi:hypothetical protein